MNIHEFQAKGLFKKYGIPVLDSQCVSSAEAAGKAAKDLGGSSWVVKAQVHAGGRGLGGGIKIGKSLEEVQALSSKMLGMNLVTAQTGAEGEKVHRVLIEKTAEIQKEFYLALLVDRDHSVVSLIASSEGGVDIEETARRSPEKITRLKIHPEIGMALYQKRAGAQALGLKKDQHLEFFKFLEGIYTLFWKEDLSLLEINPLVLTQGGRILPLDAKVSLDANASFRHKDWESYLLEEEASSAESKAGKEGFSFVRLDGPIGCMVNGAGLAMATMDMIKNAGGRPANFLDVGGAADIDRIKKAFQFIIEDKKVKGILINIFGGIVRCDLIAKGIVQAVGSLNLKKPLVARLEGNSSKEAKAILEQTELNIVSAESLAGAAEKIISLTSAERA